MSHMTGRLWILDAIREYPYPYVKSTRMSDKKNLRDTKWSSWMTGVINSVLKEKDNGLYICAQIQPFGGPQSMTVKNANNGTAYSFRDATLTCTLDCFYKPGLREKAESWFKLNEDQVLKEGHGEFSTKDMRPLWGSFGEFDMKEIWHAYHEDEEKYNKLRRLRRKYDPDGVFTSNTFCIPAAESDEPEPVTQNDKKPDTQKPVQPGKDTSVPSRQEPPSDPW